MNPEGKGFFGQLADQVDNAKYKKDRVAFGSKIGGALRRKPIIPDQWQADVLSNESRFKLLNTSRQIGKSTVVAALALHKAMFMEEALVTIYAPTEKQAKETFAKVSRFYIGAGGFVDSSVVGPHRQKGVRTMGILLPNGSRIEAMPATESSARAFSADLTILDEAAYMPDNFYRAVRPTIMMSGGDMILCSTPNGKDGFFYLEHEAEDGFWVKDVTIFDSDRVKNNKERIKEVKRETRHMSERDFRQEYMAEFVEREDQFFKDRYVDPAFTDEVEPLWEDFAVDGETPEGEEEENVETLIDALWEDFGA